MPTPAQAPKEDPPKEPTRIYTGSQVQEKLYALGFTEHNDGLKYNPYGVNENFVL